MKQRVSLTALVVGLLIALGVGSRLLSEVFSLVPPNFHGITASALLAGVLFRSRALAAFVPLAAMMASDLVIGGYEPLTMATVYAALTLPILFRGWLSQRLSPSRVAGASLASSLLFYLSTNLAAWYSWYPHTTAGLFRCYARALPFFGYTLAGDLIYTSLLFGVYALATGRHGKYVGQADLMIPIAT